MTWLHQHLLAVAGHQCMAVSAFTHYSIDAGCSLMSFDGCSLPWHVHETVSMLMLLLLVSMTLANAVPDVDLHPSALC